MSGGVVFVLHIPNILRFEFRGESVGELPWFVQREVKRQSTHFVEETPNKNKVNNTNGLGSSSSDEANRRPGSAPTRTNSAAAAAAMELLRKDGSAAAAGSNGAHFQFGDNNEGDMDDEKHDNRQRSRSVSRRGSVSARWTRQNPSGISSGNAQDENDSTDADSSNPRGAHLAPQPSILNSLFAAPTPEETQAMMEADDNSDTETSAVRIGTAVGNQLDGRNSNADGAHDGDDDDNGGGDGENDDDADTTHGGTHNEESAPRGILDIFPQLQEEADDIAEHEDAEAEAEAEAAAAAAAAVVSVDVDSVSPENGTGERPRSTATDMADMAAAAIAINDGIEYPPGEIFRTIDGVATSVPVSRSVSQRNVIDSEVRAALDSITSGEANVSRRAVTNQAQPSPTPSRTDAEDEDDESKLVQGDAHNAKHEYDANDELRGIDVNIVSFLKDQLNAMDIRNAIFLPGERNETYQVVFPYVGNIEHVIQQLKYLGIGLTFGSMSVLNAQLVETASRAAKAATEPEAESSAFLDTIKSRLLVERVAEQTKAAATFSFDFLMLTIIASLLAGVGLASNNTVVIVAAMLVSPLMGPILAVTFGAVVHDWKLFKQGLITEAIGLSVCVITGFFAAFIFIPYASVLNWPTNEMESRGFPSALLFGLAIAIPSGLGVALSVLGNNTASLVGVAISAALLPPAVNTGMLFSYAMVGDAWHVRDSGTVDRVRFLQLGGYSFALTILNIVCIYIFAFVMYKVKEISPIRGRTQFWNHLRVARRYHDVLKGTEATNLREDIRKYMDDQVRSQLPKKLLAKLEKFANFRNDPDGGADMLAFRSLTKGRGLGIQAEDREEAKRATLLDAFVDPDMDANAANAVELGMFAGPNRQPILSHTSDLMTPDVPPQPAYVVTTPYRRRPKVPQRYGLSDMDY
jgi:uncharacterized hydrophobic protein (TIGR00271 family)